MLDNVASGRMCMAEVLKHMRHPHSKSATYLINRPFTFRGAKSKEYHFPQLADVVEIPTHEPGCPALGSGPVVAPVGAPHAPACSACKCFRKPAPVSAGASGSGANATAERARVAIEVQNGMTAAAMGMHARSSAPLDTAFEELGWRQHVQALTGRPWEQLSAAEQTLLEPGHPTRGSQHWVVQDARLANDVYPFTYVQETVRRHSTACRIRATPPVAAATFTSGNVTTTQRVCQQTLEPGQT